MGCRPGCSGVHRWAGGSGTDGGSEGRISTLKRGYGWDRTRLDSLDGARVWTGQAVLAHNLVKISALAS